MRKSILLAALLPLMAGCDPQIASENDTDSTASVVASNGSREAVLIETAIMDERGFGTPMVAARAQIPTDWRTQGGVHWDRRSDCVSNHMRFNWLATSADAREALEIMPGWSWQLQGTEIQMNPCPALGIRDVRSFLETVAQRYPGARVIGFRERSALAPQPTPVEGARAYAAAGELHIAYATPIGEMRERLTATLNISELQGNVAMTVPLVLAHRTTGRDPDVEFTDRFLASMQVDTEWQATMEQTAMRLIAQISERQRQQISAWHANEMARINARGAADRAAIRMQAQSDVSQIYSNIWANSQATDDRIHRRTLETIGEYNTYADPASGGVVRESTHFDRVLRTEDGTYISTNDPYLNPAGSRELERIP